MSVIIVSYNTRDLTVRAVRSALSSTRLPIEIILVDNGSEDGSADALAGIRGPLRLLRSESNLGFAGACNLAAGMARGRYLLLLNSDTECLPGTIDRLVEFAEGNPKARIWGGRTLHVDGALNPNSVWRSKSLWSLFCSAVGLSALLPKSTWFNPEAYPDWPRDSVREVDIVSGCFFLTERSFWTELGGFDTRYFLYGEEADFCARARRIGARPMFTPDAAVVHIEGASSRSPASQLAHLLAGHITLCHRQMHGPRKILAIALIRFGVAVRFGAWWVARLAGIDRSSQQGFGFARWSEVARRRAEWWDGYT